MDADGLALVVREWGAPDAPPLLIAHGAYDVARGFDSFAPLLADAGLRVVSWDQRGNGDSSHTALYSWDADVRDAVAVMDAVAPTPMPVIGHSRGGNLVALLAAARPDRVSHLINFDGMWSIAAAARPGAEQTRGKRNLRTPAMLREWLDERRSGRPPRATRFEDLVARRHRANPRLPLAWHRYVTRLTAVETPDGWRWKADPAQGGAGFAPHRPEWSLAGLAALRIPVLAVLGLVDQNMVETGPSGDEVRPYLPATASVVALPDAGHYVHVEHPRVVASAVLKFLAGDG